MKQFYFKSQEEPKRILFSYAAPTGGHKECAEAIKRAFKLIYPSETETSGIDVITYIFPILGSLVANAYLEIIRYSPQIWNFLYDNPDIEQLTREIRQLFNFFNISKLKNLLTTRQPDLFVCTHAIPCGLFAEYKKRENCRIPLVAVITDYAVHSYWIVPQVDLYIVSNESSRNFLINKGVSPKKIRICGIPIDPLFAKKTEKQTARKKLKIDPHKPLILIMGGARGFGPVKEITEEISSIRNPLQIAVVTGSNKSLEKELFKAKLKNVHVYGYTKLIALLMDAADLLVTKPGGLTSAEALAKELPMILLNPIPGQEERNAHYLLEHGTAIKIKETGEIKETIRHLLDHPDRLNRLKSNCRKIAMPDSSVESVKEIMTLLKNMPHENERQEIETEQSITV